MGYDQDINFRIVGTTATAKQLLDKLKEILEEWAAEGASEASEMEKEPGKYALDVSTWGRRLYEGDGKLEVDQATAQKLKDFGLDLYLDERQHKWESNGQTGGYAEYYFDLLKVCKNTTPQVGPVTLELEYQGEESSDNERITYEDGKTTYYERGWVAK